MATPSVAQALRVPGELYVGVTDPTAAAPYGGTALGLVAEVKFKQMETRKVVRAVEYGSEISTVIPGGKNYLLSFVIRGADDDAFAQVIPNTFVGAAQSRRGIREPGAKLPGRDASAADALTGVLFAPDNPAHFGVMFYKAIPLMGERLMEEEDELEVLLGDPVEALWSVGFLAVRDNSDRLVEVQLLEDMTAP